MQFVLMGYIPDPVKAIKALQGAWKACKPTQEGDQGAR
jgi:hypothetical protein